MRAGQALRGGRSRLDAERDAKARCDPRIDTDAKPEEALLVLGTGLELVVRIGVDGKSASARAERLSVADGNSGGHDGGDARRILGRAGGATNTDEAGDAEVAAHHLRNGHRGARAEDAAAR